MPNEQKVTRKLRAILSADVKGYSILMADDEIHTIRTLKAYRKIMSDLISQHAGRVVDNPGDNLLAEFSSAVDAVQCAVEVQNRLKKENARFVADKILQFRIGVNIGDVVQDAGRIYGSGVNVAARIEGLADPSGVCISRNAYDHVKDKVQLGFEYLGEHEVKNIKEPVRVYKVMLDKDAPKPLVEEQLELPDKPSIAVLPFKNMSGDPGDEYIADGLTESIIGGLSKIPEMFVIASNSSFTYKGKSVKVQQVAEELGVRYVLEGSMQKFAEHLRVTAQLVDALKGHHLWSEKYDRKMGNFFSVQDDITLNIVISLQVKLTEGEQARLRHSTDSLEAWVLAVEAHGLFETYTREDNAKARGLFKKAVKLDPNYSYAGSYLGWTYWIDGVFHSAHYDREKSFERASIIAKKVLSIDNKSPDAHALLRQAMRLDPYYPNWYLGRLGDCYQMMGRYE